MYELFRGDKGQGMTEYGLILGVLVVAAIWGLFALGPKVGSLFSNVENRIN